MTLFRKRMGFVPDGPPIIDSVPPRVRVGFQHLLGDRLSGFSSSNGWQAIHEHMLRASRRRPQEQGTASYRVELLLAKCDWLEFYEIVESLSDWIREHDSEMRYMNRAGFEEYKRDLNQLLSDENVGYELDDDGKLQMSASREMVEAAAAALAATEKGVHAASAGQLRRSLENLTFRNLDPTNAVKDAVGALEGVVRTSFGAEKGDIGDFSARLRKVLHPTLAGAIDALVKVEAYRGDMAAHADRPGRAVSVDEAIFVVHMCSAAIALLATNGPESA